MHEDTTIQRLASIIDDYGGPLGYTNSRAWAQVALRRWQRFDRRSRVKQPTFDHRVEDLAKGLRDAFESDPRLVGPLMEDYRFLARLLATHLSPPAS